MTNLKRSEMAMSRVSEEFLSACLDGEERLVARWHYHIESFCSFVVINQEGFQFFACMILRSLCAKYILSASFNSMKTYSHLVFMFFYLIFPDFCDAERRPGRVSPPPPFMSIVSMPMAEEVGGVKHHCI